MGATVRAARPIPRPHDEPVGPRRRVRRTDPPAEPHPGGALRRGALDHARHLKPARAAPLRGHCGPSRRAAPPADSASCAPALHPDAQQRGVGEHDPHARPPAATRACPEPRRRHAQAPDTRRGRGASRWGRLALRWDGRRRRHDDFDRTDVTRRPLRSDDTPLVQRPGRAGRVGVEQRTSGKRHAGRRGAPSIRQLRQQRIPAATVPGPARPHAVVASKFAPWEVIGPPLQPPSTVAGPV